MSHRDIALQVIEQTTLFANANQGLVQPGFHESLAREIAIAQVHATLAVAEAIERLANVTEMNA